MEYMSRMRTLMYVAAIALWSIFEISQSMAILRLQAENRTLADSNEQLTARLTLAADSDQVADFAGNVEANLELQLSTLEELAASDLRLDQGVRRLNQRMAQLELGRDTLTDISIEVDGLSSRLDGLERSMVSLSESLSARLNTAESTIQGFRGRLMETERIARERGQ